MIEDGRGVKIFKVGEDGHKHSPRGHFLNYYSSIYRTLESSLSTLCDNGDEGIEQRNVKVTYVLLSLAKNRKYVCGNSFFYNPNF